MLTAHPGDAGLPAAVAEDAPSTLVLPLAMIAKLILVQLLL